MEPMKPMKPMVFKALPQWWPEELGAPNSAGGQNDFEYAYFAAHHRLLIREAGTISSYDTGDNVIDGVSQASDTKSAKFTSESGSIELNQLKRIS